jgi:hypothetical protein
MKQKSIHILIILFSCFIWTNCQNEKKKDNLTNIVVKSDSVQQCDTSFYLDFKVKAKKNIGGGFDLINKKLRAVFILKGKNNLKYSIEILNDTISILSKFENNKLFFVDSIHQMYLIIDDTNKIFFPTFEITDFNEDGNQDLICWTGTNVNGNRWVSIYLNNSQKKILEKLENTAESGYIWDDPIYNSKDSTVNCDRGAGAYGLSFESKYRLIGFTATPIEKRESDSRNVNYTIDKLYNGVNGKWKLKSEIKDE